MPDRLPPCFPSEEPISAFPKPRKDVSYFYQGFGGLEPPRGSAMRSRFMSATRPGPPTWGGEPWPRRRPSLEEARVGDVVVGNVELRANCACGHSKLVDAGALRGRHEPTQMLRHLRFRCRQCRRTATLGHGISMHAPKEGKR